jgi:hypothetical protein
MPSCESKACGILSHYRDAKSTSTNRTRVKKKKNEYWTIVEYYAECRKGLNQGNIILEIPNFIIVILI